MVQLSNFIVLLFQDLQHLLIFLSLDSCLLISILFQTQTQEFFKIRLLRMQQSLYLCKYWSFVIRRGIELYLNLLSLLCFSLDGFLLLIDDLLVSFDFTLQAADSLCLLHLRQL